MSFTALFRNQIVFIPGPHLTRLERKFNVLTFGGVIYKNIEELHGR